MSDEQIASAGGWCAPSAVVTAFLEGLPLEVPMVRSPRAGVPFDEATPRPKPEPEPQEPSPDGSAGHWEYGVDVSDFEDDDPEIYASSSIYERSPFLTAREARETFDGIVMKRWVRDAGEWQVA